MRPGHWTIAVDLLNVDVAWPLQGTKCEIRGTVNERGHIYSASLLNCHFHSSSPNATDESEGVLGVLTNVCSKVCGFEELRSKASPLRHMHVMQHVRRERDEPGVYWSRDLL
jgi:hypothetical protein